MANAFMQEAIERAVENVRSGRGGPFAAVVVKEGRIIAAGANCVTSTNDPTAHAEVTAIREACRILGTFELTGCEIYTSCEPCPMCLGAIYNHFASGDRKTIASGIERANACTLARGLHGWKKNKLDIPSSGKKGGTK